MSSNTDDDGGCAMIGCAVSFVIFMGGGFLLGILLALFLGVADTEVWAGITVVLTMILAVYVWIRFNQKFFDFIDVQKRSVLLRSTNFAPFHYHHCSGLARH